MNISTWEMGDIDLMSMTECIQKINDKEFEKYMNPPQTYQPTKSEVDLIFKLHAITERGNSAEVKKNRDGGFVVYEVSKKKAV